MGDYDEDEHERRERKTSFIETESAEGRTDYRGKLEYDSGASTEELLDRFNEIKSR
jgi:hypothetical protein